MIAASPAGAPGRCRPGPGLGAGYGTGSSFSYITAVLGSIRNTQCACATRLTRRAHLAGCYELVTQELFELQKRSLLR